MFSSCREMFSLASASKGRKSQLQNEQATFDCRAVASPPLAGLVTRAHDRSTEPFCVSIWGRSPGANGLTKQSVQGPTQQSARLSCWLCGSLLVLAITNMTPRLFALMVTAQGGHHLYSDKGYYCPTVCLCQ